MNTRRATCFHIAAFLITAIAALFVSGCGSDSGNTLPVHVYAGIDMSLSDESRWGPYGLMIDDVASVLRPDKDCLTLYRVDRKTRAFYDKPVGDDPDDVENALVAEITRMRRANHVRARKGTFPQQFWDAVAADSAGEREPIMVVYCSDGDNDDELRSSYLAICRDARKLADNPNVVSVSMFGVSSTNFDYWESAMRPLGACFTIHGETDVDTTPLLAQIEDAQSHVAIAAQRSIKEAKNN